MGVNQKRVEYTSNIDKPSKKGFASSIPRELIPTKRMSFIFSGIFLIVILIGVGSAVFGADFSISSNKFNFQVGFPWTFLEFDVDNVEATPIKFLGFFGDMVVWFAISYVLDVVVSVFLRAVSKKKKLRYEKARLYQVRVKKN